MNQPISLYQVPVYTRNDQSVQSTHGMTCWFSVGGLTCAQTAWSMAGNYYPITTCFQSLCFMSSHLIESECLRCHQRNQCPYRCHLLPEPVLSPEALAIGVVVVVVVWKRTGVSSSNLLLPWLLAS